MNTPLLTTKFYPPPARVDLVSRPHLIDRIHANIQQGSHLTLVSAPAGFGKTTLVVAACQQLGRPMAWLSLEPADSDLWRFWRYVLAALRRQVPALGDLAQVMLEASPLPPIETIITELINNLASLPGSLILVLDDYHTIESQEVHTSLNFFLDHLSPQLHLVLTTRADPPLSLARRRGRRELVELRTADLRFTPQETAHFLNGIMKLGLPQPDVDLLVRRTEGWPAGLQMVALALQNQVDCHAFITSFAGDDHYIGDYLVEEVLQRQPPYIQDFLRKTSILQRLNGPLCDALLDLPENNPYGSSQAILTSLDHANLFVTSLDSRQEWYRYHRLFSDLLQHRLRQLLSNSEMETLHVRAAHWLQQHQQWPEAFEHAVQAGDDALPVSLVEQSSFTMFRTSQIPTWREWVLRLPLEKALANPTICLFWGWAGLSTGHVAEAERAQQAVEQILGLTTEVLTQGPQVMLSLPPEVVNLLIIVAAQRVSLNQSSEMRSRTEPILDCLSHLPETEIHRPAFEMFPVLYFNLGLAYELGDQPRKAAPLFEQAILSSQKYNNPHILPMAISHLARLQVLGAHLDEALKNYRHALEVVVGENVPPSPLIAMAYAGLGEMLYERNELEEARQSFEKSLPLGKSWNNWESLAPAYIGLARIHLARQNPQAASTLLEEAVQLWQQLYHVPPMPALLTWQVLIQADPAQALVVIDSIQQFEAPSGLNFLVHSDETTALLARLLLLAQRPAQALQILDPSLSADHLDDRPGMAISLFIQKSIALQFLNRQEEALALAGTGPAPGGTRRLYPVLRG